MQVPVWPVGAIASASVMFGLYRWFRSERSAETASIGSALKILPRKARTAWLMVQWMFARQELKRDLVPDSPSARPPVLPPGVDPEDFLQAILVETKAQSFLEIGIGEIPKLPRLRLMSRLGIRYTGCDFGHVCNSHDAAIRNDAAIDRANVRFLSNRPGGSYSWTLFELLERGEKFDAIYFDGHHTFYVDCPALMLAHCLLKPGGVLMVDDVEWTLDFLRNHLVTSFEGWRFFRGVYDFAPYDRKQQSLPHVGMMAQTILIDTFKYSKLDQYSISAWWALRKPLESTPAN